MKIERILGLITLSGLFLSNGHLGAEEVKVAIAANFTEASRHIASLFEKTTGHQLNISFGSTGKLYAQIENGAPFEVFLSADTERAKKAEQEGLAIPGSRFVYAKGKLALWSVKADLFDDGEAYLKNGNFAHLAIANPKTAPYGFAAYQVLQKLTVESQLQPKLVRGDSISQTFQFIATGNVEAGLVAYSQVKLWRGDQGTAWVIPQAYYAPIEQAAVLLNAGESNPAAGLFLDFLKSRDVRNLIKSYGYEVE